MKIDLNHKKILFIAPCFYHYEVEIANLIRSKYHAEVMFFPEKKYDFIHRCMYKSKKLLLLFVKYYYQHILNRIRNNPPDILLVIRGEWMPEFFLEELQKINPAVKKIMYQWDSEQRNHYIHLQSYFDILKTFDHADAKKYGTEYLPLFYTPFPEKTEKTEYSSDCLFVSVYYQDRYEFFLKIKKQLEQQHLQFKYYIYLPFFTYLKLLVQGKAPRREHIHFSSLDRKIYQQWLLNTKIAIDYTISAQTGLPMRVIEALGAGKKIITNNLEIFLLLDDESMVKQYTEEFNFEQFLKMPSSEKNSSMEKYSLCSWLENLLMKNV